MDIATSVISNMAVASFPHAAAEARRDTLARETIPQINQTAQSLNGQATSQGSVQTAPANANLYAQADALIKVGQEKHNQGKKEGKVSKKEEESSDTKGLKGKSASSTSLTSTGASLDQNVTAAGATNAALGGAFGSNSNQNQGGATYSEDLDKRHQKGEGFSSKAIAKAYNRVIPHQNLGLSLDVQA